jgi:hypothetical protein
MTVSKIHPYDNKAYMLRWRFEYWNRPARYGQWNQAASNISDMAYAQNFDGMVAALIEAKDFRTREIFTIAECDGDDYINFQWMSSYRTDFRTKLATQEIIGLKLIARDEVTEALTTGLVYRLPAPQHSFYETWAH